MKGGKKSNVASGLFLTGILLCIFLMLAAIFKDQILEIFRELITPIGPGGMVEKAIVG